jgi:hypothetical protein
VGGKWKRFFQNLSINAGFDPDPSHIWLLHFLFLDALNEDIQEWANAWNHHKLSLEGERNKSPAELRAFSLIEHGPRGFDQAIDNIQEYGIDWESYHDHHIQQHHSQENPQEVINPFVSHQPESHLHVEIDEIQNPLTNAQMDAFVQRILGLPVWLWTGWNIEHQEQLFIHALNIAVQVTNSVQ